MGWKIYWALSVVLVVIGGVGFLSQQASWTLIGWLSLPINLVAMLGLFGYAFKRPILSSHVWRIVLWLFAALNAAAAWEMVRLAAERGFPLVSMAGALLFTALLTLPTLVALSRYARS